MPVFLAAFAGARGLPALLYRGLLDNRRIAIAGLMQATSLPFIVAATAIGEDLGLVDAATAAGFIAAGLLSVLLFPWRRSRCCARDRRSAGDTAAPADADEFRPGGGSPRISKQ